MSSEGQYGYCDTPPKEINTYNACVSAIKSLSERLNDKGEDTFDLRDWRRSNTASLTDFSFVLRALLTNSPNGCHPDLLFSMFNATLASDQKSSYPDYLALPIQQPQESAEALLYLNLSLWWWWLILVVELQVVVELEVVVLEVVVMLVVVTEC